MFQSRSFSITVEYVQYLSFFRRNIVIVWYSLAEFHHHTLVLKTEFRYRSSSFPAKINHSASVHETEFRHYLEFFLANYVHYQLLSYRLTVGGVVCWKLSIPPTFLVWPSITDTRSEIFASYFFELAGAGPVRRPLASLYSVEGFVGLL